MHEGDLLQVRVDAINRSFTGKIVRFTRDVNFETRTMETEVDVENNDLSIAPGMYANTALQLAHVHNVVTIPVEALVLNAHNQQTVYVLDADNRIHIRNVQVGIEGSKLAQISSGLSAGRSRGDRRPGKIPGRRRSQPAAHARACLRNRAGIRRHDRPESRGATAEEANNAKVCALLSLLHPHALPGCRCSSERSPWRACLWTSFPPIDMPVVVVATFYNGMPPEQIEADITNTFERFFTLAANVDHSESRSLTGVSLIKIYFKPGTDPNAALSNIANLAMADLRRLPPGTLPPVVLGMTASTQPVCLVTLKGEGLNETRLKDLAQFQVRNQISNVQGASVPQPYGGTYRQIQIYVDPLKLEARNLSLNDVVTAVNNSNLILPAGDVRIGSKDFNIYANSQFPDANAMNEMPLKSVGNSSVLVGDIGKAVDSGALQYNIVRIDGQRSVYVPIFKQGGDRTPSRSSTASKPRSRNSSIFPTLSRPPWSSISLSSSSWPSPTSRAKRLSGS